MSLSPAFTARVAVTMGRCIFDAKLPKHMVSFLEALISFDLDPKRSPHQLLLFELQMLYVDI